MKKRIFALPLAVLLLTGCGAAEPALSDEQLPAVLFYMDSDYPDQDADGPEYRLTLLMRDGTVYAHTFYTGDAYISTDAIAEAFEAGTLSENFEPMKCGVSAEQAAEQYRKAYKAAQDAPQLIYPTGEPAVEDTRTFWYTDFPQEDGTKLHLQLGEDFCGTHYPSESEAVNEVYEWFSAVLKG